MRVVLLFLSLSAAVNAQTSWACSVPTATATVSDYDSAASLASQCKNLSGSLEISNSTEEDILLDGLETIGGNLVSVGSQGNGFTALSSSTLYEILGELKLASASSLSSVEFDKLNFIRGLDIASNVALQNIKFPALMYSYGPMTFTGNFSSILLPALKIVNGTFQVKSATDFDCSGFDEDDEAGVFSSGAYSCSGRNTTTPTASSTNPSTSTTMVVETKRPSSVAPTVISTASPANASSSSATTSQENANSGLTTKDKLAIGLGTSAAIVTFSILIIVWVSWKIRAAHKKQRDAALRTPITLTGNMLLDYAPESPKPPGKFGDPRYSGLSQYEVQEELDGIHVLESERKLTDLESERKNWLMQHKFLRVSAQETREIAELEG